MFHQHLRTDKEDSKKPGTHIPTQDDLIYTSLSHPTTELCCGTFSIRTIKEGLYQFPQLTFMVFPVLCPSNTSHRVKLADYTLQGGREAVVGQTVA